jgi:hypothetical protein
MTVFLCIGTVVGVALFGGAFGDTHARSGRPEWDAGNGFIAGAGLAIAALCVLALVGVIS